MPSFFETAGGSGTLQQFHCRIWHEVANVARNIRILPIAELLGEAIERTATESSVSSLFD